MSRGQRWVIRLLVLLVVLVALAVGAVFLAEFRMDDLGELDALAAGDGTYLVVGSDSRENLPDDLDGKFGDFGGERADVIMLLHREAYYHAGEPDWAAENPDREHTAELIIAKQRNGPTGVVEMEWDAKTTRFNPSQWRGSASTYSPSPSPVVTTPAASAPFQAGSSFASRPKTGPAENHRDGGGSDAQFDADIDDIPI